MENQSLSIDDFINRLVAEKGFEDVDDEVRDQIKNDLRDRVEDRINATILQHMPPEKLEEMDKMLESAGPQEIQSFCRENIENLDEVIAQALVEFRSTYLKS